MKTYKIPSGSYAAIYDDMSKQSHLLIAGKTGSGKSIVINGIIHSLLLQNTPSAAGFVLVDPKRVELIDYKNIPHCLFYASEPGQPADALRYALRITENRFAAMQARREKKYTGGNIYVIIDELADLMTTDKNTIVPLLQRLCQIGRAARVHVIAATQCPLSKIIPTEIKVNFDSVLGLRTVTKQHSRNIIEQSGCENLPPYGYGYYRTPSGFNLVKLPMIPESAIQSTVRAWQAQ